jgi:hypothetical protein
MPGPILVHSLDDARTALAAAAALDVPLTLASAPGAGGYAGPAWFGELIAAARGEYPAVAMTAVLDCGDAPGHVMAAVRWAMAAGGEPFVVLFSGDPARDKALGEIADAASLQLIRELPPALDLRRVRDPGEACRAWLAGVAALP